MAGGVFIGLALHVTVILWVTLLSGVAFFLDSSPDVLGTLMIWPLTYIGAAQLVYEVPAAAVAIVKRRRQIAQGIAVAAGVTLLFNLAFLAFLSWLGTWVFPPVH